MATLPLSNIIDPPPRLTGDAGQDTVAVIQWLNAFYVKGILSGGLLQPQNMDQSLISLGALVGVADMLAYYTAEDVFDLTGFTAFARTLLDDADADAARATLGAGDVDGPASATNNHVAVFDGTTGKLLKDGGAPAGDVVGPAGAVSGNVVLFDTATGKLIKDGGTLGSAAFTSSAAYDAAGAAAAAQAASQPVDSQLSSIAALVDAAGWLHNSGAGVFAYSTPTASDVGAQPADADLTTWAGITPGANVGTALAVAVGSAGAFVVNGGALGTPSSGTLSSCSGLPAAGVSGTALVTADIGASVQAYNSNLTAINQALTTSSTPTFAGLTLTTANYIGLLSQAPSIPAIRSYHSTNVNGSERNWWTLTNYEGWGTYDIQVSADDTLGQAPSITRSSMTSAGILTLSGYGAGTATFSAAGVISSVSDERLKVKDGVIKDPIPMLMALEPGYFYGKPEANMGPYRQLGFYAQNVRKAIGPEAAPDPEDHVVRDRDRKEISRTPRPWGYFDRSVLAVAVNSAQNHENRVKTLEAEIAALKAAVFVAGPRP